jgi:hypothetical protein
MRCSLFVFFALGVAACAQQQSWGPVLDAYFRAQKTGICSVHHIRMERHEVAVSYGLEIYDDAWGKASRQFPFANAHVSGGCEVPAHRERASVYVCPRCRVLQRQWALRHRKNPESRWILEKTKT